MRLGFVGSHGSAAQVVEMAESAEEHDWDGFFTWDGISVGGAAAWDPWVILGAAAVRTERIRLGAMVFALPRRRPWKVAKEAVTIDHLSRGRLVLPVGLGAVEDGGFSRVGEEMTTRGRAELLDDGLAVLDAAWSGEEFSYTGTRWSVDRLVLEPRPVQRPRIPVWVVGAWPHERSVARAARWDGVVLQQRGTEAEYSPADVAAAVASITARRADGGLTDRYDVIVQGRLPEDRDAATDHLRAYAQAGATWWIESRWDAERDNADSLLAAIRQGPPSL